MVAPAATTSYTVQGGNAVGSGNIASATVTVVASPTLSSASPYDGIYQWDDGYYLSVHQIGGGVLIGTIYWVYTANTEQVGARAISESDTFDLFHGQIVGSSATISGTRFYRACTLSYDLTFNSDSSLTVRLTSVSNSLGVNVADVDCAARYNSVGSGWTVPRIY